MKAFATSQLFSSGCVEVISSNWKCYTLSLNTRICSHIFKRIHSSFRHTSEGLSSEEFSVQCHHRHGHTQVRPIFPSFLSHQEKTGITRRLCVSTGEQSHTWLQVTKPSPNRLFWKLICVLGWLNPRRTFNKYPCLVSCVKAVCKWCPDAQWGTALPGQCSSQSWRTRQGSLQHGWVTGALGEEKLLQTKVGVEW